MQITSLENLAPLLQCFYVAIHNAYCEEESLVSTDIRESNIKNLYHPINHSCAEACLELMVGQVIRSQLVLFLDFSEVGINQATVVTDKITSQTSFG